MADKPYKIKVLTASRSAPTRRERGGLLKVLTRRQAAPPAPAPQAAPPPAFGAPGIRISLPKPPAPVPDPPAAIEPPSFEESDTEEIAYEDADTEEIAAGPDAGGVPEGAAIPTLAPRHLQPVSEDLESGDFAVAPQEEDLARLEQMLDDYLASGDGDVPDPRLGMDNQWWTWFESLETEASYSFGLSGVWLRWFETLDRAA